MHIGARTHARTSARTRAHPHNPIRMPTQTRMTHAYAGAASRARARTCTPPKARAHTLPHTRAHVKTLTHTPIRTCAPSHAHTHVRTCVRKCARTHVRIYQNQNHNFVSIQHTVTVMYKKNEITKYADMEAPIIGPPGK